MQGHSTAPRRVAIYCRVSSAGQEDKYSLSTQEASCRAYAEAHGYSVAGVYQDVHTGAELWERPQLATVRGMIERGAVNAVIAYAIDRLSRKQAHIAIIADECERARVALLFVTEEFEQTPVGVLIRNVKAFAAELEREKTRERTARGHLARVQSGKLRPGSRPLYGYRWRDGTKGAYEIDDETA